MNWNTPRFIRCYAEDLEFLHLPRAMADTAAALVRDVGSQLPITDRRADPPTITVSFTGTLRDTQSAAVTALTHHDLGVLEASPG
ncbi:hypothetical protein CcI49_30215 [Frankia sp. CcI49]|uniref:hypothetical protein n=1 Tax=Frankia sp. CcI49 TaxID=1745382 RepID=UPI0009762989|nr:hypothetical protein [Frankia sp. CcI49]ONH54636.1 hypothetical protein CcI49_30215 [Frankia sp. CcI49]